MDGVKPHRPSAASFNQTPLVRLLAALPGGPVAPSSLSLAEQWSRWLTWTDAIALSGVLAAPAVAGSAAVAPLPGPQAQASNALALKRACQGLRRDLLQAINTDPVLAPRAPPPRPAATPTPMDPADMAALRHQYQTHQRTMDARVNALRTQVRAAMAALPGLPGRLAALDTVLGKALAGQQRQGLARLPSWLGRQAGEREALTQAAACAEARAWLGAELDLRLQPVQALIDTLMAAPQVPA